MKAETCSSYVILINYVMYNKNVLDYKFICIILIIENMTGMPRLKI